MAYTSLEDCLTDLEKTGQLIRIKEEVDPYLEMAAIHLRVYASGGPALLFEKVKGSRYCAVSNLFGTTERSNFIFRETLPDVKKMIALKSDPMSAIKQPFKNIGVALAAWKALPKKVLSSASILPSLFRSVYLTSPGLGPTSGLTFQGIPN